MKKPSVVRLYHLSDAKLVTTGKEKIAFMRRDVAVFTPFGITAALMTNLETAINTFSDTITDIESLKSQTVVTANKNAKADELRVAIRTVMACAKLQYGTRSARYKQFGTNTLSRQSDADLCMTGKIVVRVGTKSLETLSANGLTVAMLTAITTLCSEFEVLLLDVKIKMCERDSIQENRVEAGNSIYKTLIKYTTMGLSIWETSNVAKYNDYVIYNTVKAKMPKVTALLTF
jgi:hypothetical protein